MKLGPLRILWRSMKQGKEILILRFFTTHDPAPRKLHLGCGYTHLPGFVNIDIIWTPQVDRLHDLRRPFPYPANSVASIFSEHVFEHFTPSELKCVFQECYRILSPRGELVFSIPDFLKLTHALLQFEKKERISSFYKGELERFDIRFPHEDIRIENAYYFDHLIHQYGEHKFYYTFAVMKYLLKEVGFEIAVKRAWNKKIDSAERKHTSLFILARKKKSPSQKTTQRG